MSTVKQGKNANRIGPHWPGGDTPINVGSYTKIKPVIDEGRCIAPCKLVCPAGTDIQGFIALITEGRYKEALKLIKQTNPLPLVIGRVCPGFCEAKCRRGRADGTIAINALERFVADYDQSTGANYVPEVKPGAGHKVAIIGGGPAGLTVAYYLAAEGHEVTIFDANPELGGMLRYGIPRYRLPKTILDKEVASIASVCSEIHCGLSLGRDFTIEDLKMRGYEAIFVGIGAQANQRLELEGENLPSVLSGVKFLWDLADGKKVNFQKKKVIVIGGGNTAVDSARTAIRLGAEEVTVLYRRSKEEIPAIPEEVEGAEQDGIRFHFLVAPIKVDAKDGVIDSIECIRTKLGEPDGSGRRRPQPIAGSEFRLKTDIAIAAIGQNTDISGLPKEILNSSGYVKVNMETMQTSVDGVFAGGDCVSGSATVVEAVAAGRRAAAFISQYLSGQQIVTPERPLANAKDEFDEIIVSASEEVKPEPRVETPVLSQIDRKGNFNEIKRGFTDVMAKKEAQRCLQCGACRLCWLLCPDGAISVHENGGRQKLAVNHDLCKACGICAKECPLRAIEMLPTERQ